jgi:asparagine synthase (glutamine-hydrolysing)
MMPAHFSSPSDTGAQPLLSEDGKLILAVNGEIYNHVALRAGLGPGVKFKTHSDCEVILPLVRPNLTSSFTGMTRH